MTPRPPSTMPHRPLSLRSAAILAALVWTALFAMRLLGAPDIMHNDQEMPASYVIDALQNGHILCQRDFHGEIMSKPPMYTWLATGLAKLSGEPGALALYVPTGLAVLGVGLLIVRFAGSVFGPLAGLLGALAWLLSTAAVKHMALARTDALFCFFTTLAALLAWRAWRAGSGWTLFWLAAAGATLTKGPLGVMIAAIGLSAALWERRSGERTQVHGSHLAGVAVYLAVVAGWFVLAYMQMGPPLIDKLLGKELLGHAVVGSGGRTPLENAYKPLLYLLSRLAPWSAFTCIALWRVFAHPADSAEPRRFERFLTCWMLLSLVPFSFAAAQRPDHILPLLPAAAMLAGREMALLLAAITTLRRRWIIGGVTLSAITLHTVHYHVVRPKHPDITNTIAAARLADELRPRLDAGSRLGVVDGTRFGVEWRLRRIIPRSTVDDAAAALQAGTIDLLLLRDLDSLCDALAAEAQRLRILDEAGVSASGSFILVELAAPDSAP